MESVFVIAGFLLRLGIPLMLTAVLVRWLQWLDARWQLQAEQARRRAGLSLLKPSVYRPVCWEVRGCPPERRANCAAFAQPETPCWQTFRDDRRHLRAACLECVVFRQAPAPVVVRR